MANRTDTTSRIIVDMLKDPCTSTWLRNALSLALKRDPVDAANDAELLGAILTARADEHTTQQGVELFIQGVRDFAEARDSKR